MASEESNNIILDEEKGNGKSLFFAILITFIIYVAIFAAEISASIHSLNIIVSANKAFAITALFGIVFFLISETLSRYTQFFKRFVPIARRVGVIGLISAFTHAALVMFVLTGTYSDVWLNQQLLSLTAAKISIILFLVAFLTLTAYVSLKLGKWKWIVMETAGYLGIILIVLHMLFMIKPDYYNVGKTILSGFHQLEVGFIVAFLVSVLFFRIVVSFINKKISLQAKVILHTFLLLTIGAATIGSYIIVSDLQSHKEDAFMHNQHMATYLLSEMKSNPNAPVSDFYSSADILSDSSDQAPLMFFMDSNKEIIHYPGKKKEGIQYAHFNTKKLAPGGIGWEEEYSENGDTMLDTVIDLGPENGYLVASTDFTQSGMAHFRTEITYSIFLVTLVTAVTAILTIFFTRKNILEPIKKITDASKRISEGDFNTKITVKTNDEFATLANVFNEMAEKLQKQINDLRKVDKLKNEFIAIASHNLRTPLTTLKGYLETLTLPGADKLSKKQKDILQKAQRSATTLTSLTEGLLDITSLETEGVKIEKNPVDLSKIINGVIQSLGAAAQEKGIQIENMIGDREIMTIGDESKLKQAFLGVLDNAIKFNKKGGKITLEKIVNDTKHSYIGRGEVIITIKDTGIGIAKEEREDIFKKFNRGTSTYTYEYEGVGLGLYLTRLIILAHHGRIWFESDVNKGTIFYISLPAK